MGAFAEESFVEAVLVIWDLALTRVGAIRALMGVPWNRLPVM